MKEVYIVAQNAFTVSAPDGLVVWAALRPRFSPFAVPAVENVVLEIDIRPGRMAVSDAERIYEPDQGGVGIVGARASRLTDGSFVMEFTHVAETEPRVWLKMSSRLDKAEIIIDRDGERDAHYFLTHVVMIAFTLATSGNGTLMIHASSVIYEGKAYLFQGKSGTGKSTHASLWVENIGGVELLNDDNPVIRFSADGEAMAYGSPWSGKTHCYRNVAAPIGGFVRIVRAQDNELRRLSPLKAYASLTTSVFFMPFVSEGLREVRHRTIERLVGAVGCYEMHCRPDADAALTCRAGLYQKNQN